MAQHEKWSIQHLPSPEEHTKTDVLVELIIKESIALRKSNWPKLSLEFIEQALNSNFSSPWLDHNKARSLESLKRFKEAELILQELIEKTDKPRLVQASQEALKNCKKVHSIHQAITLKNNGHFQEAITLLNKIQLSEGTDEQISKMIKEIIYEEENSKKIRNPLFDASELQGYYIQLKETEAFVNLLEATIKNTNEQI